MPCGILEMFIDRPYQCPPAEACRAPDSWPPSHAPDAARAVANLHLVRLRRLATGVIGTYTLSLTPEGSPDIVATRPALASNPPCLFLYALIVRSVIWITPPAGPALPIAAHVSPAMIPLGAASPSLPCPAAPSRPRPRPLGSRL